MMKSFYFIGHRITHLDDKNSEIPAILKWRRYDESNQNHFYVLKAMFQQRNFNACFIESFDKPIEIFTINFVFDLHEYPKTLQLEKIATYRNLCNAGTQDSYVEKRRDKHIWHNEGKSDLKLFLN